jgi:signal transduction histidine kinase
MKTSISSSVLLVKRKESLLFLIIFITGLNLFGWLSGKMGLTSFSIKYIPIPHSSAVIFIALSILFLIKMNVEKSGLFLSGTALFLIAFYCSLIFVDFLFNFTWDVETIFIRNPEKFGSVLIDRMSPITSFLFILLCICIPAFRKRKTEVLMYVGASLSMLVLITSSVLLIGYLYKAPVLYGSQFIPVSLPTAICFFLFSITLIRVYEFKYLTFNLIKDNKVTLQLLKSFLPIVVFVVILQGFLISNFTFHKNNPALSVAIILFIVVVIMIILVFRISASIGSRLLRAEIALKENEKQLLQLNVDKDRFISILSHDLINPFNNLLGLSEILKEDCKKLSPDEIEVMADSINKSAQKTFNLLEDILIWGRTQQGNIPFNPQKLSFSEICNYITDLFDSVANKKMITIRCITPDNINVFADINMIKTIVRNLVSNALKFTNNGGTITIKAEKNSEHIVVSVSDNGIGISSEDLPKLFDISQVLSTKGTEDEAGTGLGLLICKEFVEKHKGTIMVESSMGKGSTFKFSLPEYSDKN